MVAKSPEAFRTISEVAEDLDLPQHVLRFWETRFPQIKPLKRGGGRRYYRPDDVDLLRGIRFFLYGEGYTIRGVQRILKEQGPRFVTAAGRGEFPGLPGRRGNRDEEPLPEEEDDGDEDMAPAPHRPPAFTEPALVRPRTPAPAFDVEREDHDPDDAPEHVIDEDEDPDEMEEGARRMAARFAPERPQPAIPPRPAPPPPAQRATPAAEPRSTVPPSRPPPPSPTAERPKPERPPAPPPRAQPAPSGGLDPEDAETLKATLVELLELKRILDQAR